MENMYKNGWEGKHASEHLSAKEVAERLRKFIKSDKDLSRCKWSVRSGWAAYEYTLDVALMAAPFDPFSDEFKEKHPEAAARGYSDHGKADDFLSPECRKVMHKVIAFVASYNWDHSDGMIDYFDRHIYDKYHIGGGYDKPFRLIESKKSAEQSETKESDEPVDGLRIIDYSEKAVAVIGETKAVKDRLKELGGRFNAKLSCGPGWIFSKTKRNDLKAAFNI